MTLRYDLEPVERGLVTDDDGVGWVFPPDCVSRLREALKANLAGCEAPSE